MDKPFQREGAKSNADVGRKFELDAKEFLDAKEELVLEMGVKILVGVEEQKKEHAFDLGCLKEKVIVECKSHKWTKGNNVPSAKLTCWNEAMFYFMAAPLGYRKIMFVLRDFSENRGLTLAEYYLRTYPHLVPKDVEFWEYDESSRMAKQLPKRSVI